MNELCFTVFMLNLSKFLTIDFNKQTLHKKWSFPLRISSVNVWKISSSCTRQMLCLDYSNLQERRNISKFYILLLEGIYFLYMVLEMELLNGSFNKRKMFQPKCHWVEIKYLVAVQNRRRQLFFRSDNAF